MSIRQSANAQVGLRIRQLRRQRGWTGAELGRRLQPARTSSAVSDMELGKTNFTLRLLDMLADTFDISVGELFPAIRPPAERPMTKTDVDQIKIWIDLLSKEQLALLWRWVTREYVITLSPKGDSFSGNA